MDGLVVIKRAYRFQQEAVSSRVIVAKYRGIEGMPWPDDAPIGFKLSCGLAMPEQLPSVLNYYHAIKQRQKCDLLYIQTHEVGTPTHLPPSGFVFSGYDFGNYISEYNAFSVLFNEVLLGKHDALRRFASRLNGNLLLAKEDDVAELKLVRECLVQDGADLETSETDEEFFKIEIYTFTNGSE